MKDGSPRWLAKSPKKNLRVLEEKHDTRDIPVKLEKYRNEGWRECEGEKLLP